MEDYSAMETFSLWFCSLFWGGVSLCLILAWVGLLFEWKSLKKERYARTSDPSDDFFAEREGVLATIENRVGADGVCSLISKDEEKDLAALKDSSEVASLFRFAHFAGCHLTFEQIDGKWEDDPEYLNPDVFKTDMKDAASKREAERLNRYKRYFDPPKSKREQALSNIS